MTVKISDLEEFVDFVRKSEIRGGELLREISANKLEYYIGLKFGISHFVQRGVKEALIKFGFMRLVGVGIFQIIDKEVEKKKFEKEVDMVLEKMGVSNEG